MQISKHKVAAFDFTVSTDQGEVLDSSSCIGPFSYIHGIGYLIPGLESALEGKSVGDSFRIAIPPSQAYGERDESLLMTVPKSMIQTTDDLEVGMQIQVQNPHGTHFMEVTGITDDQIALDGNHPLAGMTLHFTVSIVDVREATDEELKYGHPTGGGFTTICGCRNDLEGGHGSGCGCGCH